MNQPPASSTSTSTARSLPPAPVRTPLSRREQRELRAVLARRERDTGPVIIQVRVEEGDTLESLSKRTGLSQEKIAAAVAAGKGKTRKGEQLVLIPGTELEFESPFKISTAVTAAVLELEELESNEKLTKEMADRQRRELVAMLREHDRVLGAQASSALARSRSPLGRALSTALDVMLLFASVSAVFVAGAASMGVAAALQKRSRERKAAAAEAAAAAAKEGGEEEEGENKKSKRRDWSQVVAEAMRAAAQEEKAASAAEQEKQDPDAVAAAAAAAAPRVPAWVLGKAVWRVRMASGVAEAAVPLPRPKAKASSSSSSSSSSPPTPAPPDLVWLAFEDEKDVEAWSRWLTAPGGPLADDSSSSSNKSSSKSSASSSPSPNLPTASVIRAAPEQLHGAAKEAGRALAFVPKGAFRPLPRPGESQRSVLMRLAKAAHPQRCGVDLLGPTERAAAVESAKVHGWAPTSGSSAAEVAEEYERTMAKLEREEMGKEREEGGDTIEVEVEKETLPPPPPPTTTTTKAATPPSSPPPAETAAPKTRPEIPNSVSMENLDKLRAAARGETGTQRRIRHGEPVVFADEEEVANATSPSSAPSSRGEGGGSEEEGDDDDGDVIDPLAFNTKSSPEPTFDAVIVGHVGQRDWYRALGVIAVPVLDLGGGERGLLEIHGVLPPDFDAGQRRAEEAGEEEDDDEEEEEEEETGPTVVVAFEDHDDAQRLALIWHCSGLAAAARAEVQSVTGMSAGELDAAALRRGAVALVIKKGALRLKPQTPADALLTGFAAAAAEQLVISLPEEKVKKKEAAEVVEEEEAGRGDREN